MSFLLSSCLHKFPDFLLFEYNCTIFIFFSFVCFYILYTKPVLSDPTDVLFVVVIQFPSYVVFKERNECVLDHTYEDQPSQDLKGVTPVCPDSRKVVEWGVIEEEFREKNQVGRLFVSDSRTS